MAPCNLIPRATQESTASAPTAEFVRPASPVYTHDPAMTTYEPVPKAIPASANRTEAAKLAQIRGEIKSMKNNIQKMNEMEAVWVAFDEKTKSKGVARQMK